MGTIDNVYVFNYLINKLGKGKKLVVIFVDLKAIFDTVDRSRVSCETMKARGIRERLIGRAKEALRETRSRMIAGGEETEKSF